MDVSTDLGHSLMNTSSFAARARRFAQKGTNKNVKLSDITVSCLLPALIGRVHYPLLPFSLSISEGNITPYLYVLRKVTP